MTSSVEAPHLPEVLPQQHGQESIVGNRLPFEIVFLPQGTEEDEHGHAQQLWLVGGNVTQRPHSGGFELDGVFTDNPDLMVAMLDGGPELLDDPRFAGHQELTVVEDGRGKVSVSDKYSYSGSRYTFTVDDGIMTVHFGAERGETMPLSTPEVERAQREIIEANIEYGNDNRLQKISGEDISASFVRSRAYQFPKVREVYDLLGITEPVYTNEKYPKLVSFTAPTPATLQERLAEARQVLFVPELEFVSTGHISSEDYVSILAEGKFPVGVSDFAYYFHDVTNEHMVALVEYGEPLIDMMTRFARAVENTDVVHFTEYMEDEQYGDLSGSEKMSAAAQRLDAITSDLSYISIEMHEDDRPYTGHGLALIQNFVDVMRAAGELEGSIIEQAILARGVVASSEEITGALVVEELVQLTRERFGIEGLPKRVPKPVLEDDSMI